MVDRSFQSSRAENGIIGAGKMAQRSRMLSALAENPSSVPSTHVRSQLPLPFALEGTFAFGFCGQHCVNIYIPPHRYTNIYLIKSNKSKSLKGENAVVNRNSNVSVIRLLFVSM